MLAFRDIARADMIGRSGGADCPGRAGPSGLHTHIGLK